MKFTELTDQAKNTAVQEIIRFEKNKYQVENPFMRRIEQYVINQFANAGLRFKTFHYDSSNQRIILHEIDKYGSFSFIRKTLKEKNKELLDLFEKLLSIRRIEIIVEWNQDENTQLSFSLKAQKDEMNSIMFQIRSEKSTYFKEEVDFIFQFDELDDVRYKYKLLILFEKEFSETSSENFKETIPDIVSICEYHLPKLEAIINEELNTLYKQAYEILNEGENPNALIEFYTTLLEKDAKNWRPDFLFNEQGELIDGK